MSTNAEYDLVVTVIEELDALASIDKSHSKKLRAIIKKLRDAFHAYPPD